MNLTNRLAWFPLGWFLSFLKPASFSLHSQLLLHNALSISLIFVKFLCPSWSSGISFSLMIRNSLKLIQKITFTIERVTMVGAQGGDRRAAVATATTKTGPKNSGTSGWTATSGTAAVGSAVEGRRGTEAAHQDRWWRFRIRWPNTTERTSGRQRSVAWRAAAEKRDRFLLLEFSLFLYILRYVILSSECVPLYGSEKLDRILFIYFCEWPNTRHFCLFPPFQYINKFGLTIFSSILFYFVHTQAVNLPWVCMAKSFFPLRF